MSEFWKSNPKKFCDYCKIWIQDNKASIGIHESGKKHKDNVKQRLDEIKKKAEQKKHEDKVYNKSMAAIEKAAMEAMKNDLEENPSLRKQYGSASKSESIIIASTSKPSSSGEPKKDKKKESSKTESKDDKGVKRKLENQPEAKIGKWETIEVKKPHVEVSAKPIDLQLPSKSSTFKRIDVGLEELEKLTSNTKNEDKKDAPKWVPLNSFQSVDSEPPIEDKNSESQQTIKEEPLTERTEDAKIPEENKSIKKEPVEEKVPTLKSSSKKKKLSYLKSETRIPRI